MFQWKSNELQFHSHQFANREFFSQFDFVCFRKKATRWRSSEPNPSKKWFERACKKRSRWSKLRKNLISKYRRRVKTPKSLFVWARKISAKILVFFYFIQLELNFSRTTITLLCVIHFFFFFSQLCFLSSFDSSSVGNELAKTIVDRERGLNELNVTFSKLYHCRRSKTISNKFYNFHCIVSISHHCLHTPFWFRMMSLNLRIKR